jgi:hypothetical protein
LGRTIRILAFCIIVQHQHLQRRPLGLLILTIPYTQNAC